MELNFDLLAIRNLMFLTVGTNKLSSPYDEMYGRMWEELIEDKEMEWEEYTAYTVTSFLCGH